MKKKRRSTVAVIAAPRAPHASAVVDALVALGAESLYLDAGDATTPALMSIGSEPERLPFSVAYVDVLPQAAPRAFEARGSYWLYDDWQDDWLASLGRRALLDALFADVEARGVTLVSSPLSALAYNKPAQLTALARAGLPIPPFIITNDADVARAFLREHEDAIVKPASGGGFAMPITAAQVDDLPLRRAPAIFQKRVRGDDVRVTTVRGAMLSAVRIVNDDADSAIPDFRAQSSYRAGTTRYESIEPTSALQELCTTILKACGMHFGGIDFKRDAAGQLHLLECNAQPGWLAIEAATGANVTESLARYLIDLSG